MRILVADDERDSVDTLVVLLADEGHEVRGVYCGADVLPTMEQFEPDWVLLDIAMPDVSGFELAQKIRRRWGESRPRLIAISGRYKKGSDRLLAELAGFNHHVPKPYEPGALLALLKN